MNVRSRQEIEAEVDELASEVLGYVPELTVEEARSMVYEEIPELYDEYQAAPATVPVQPISKSVREPTLGEEVHAVVRKRASHLAWTEWPHKSIEDLEWEVWSTPEGQALYELYRSEQGRQPISEVEHRIAKSEQHSDAWQVFRQWRAG
jgi:hypothetical protein